MLLTSDEKYLLSLFRQCDAEGQERVLAAAAESDLKNTLQGDECPEE